NAAKVVSALAELAAKRKDYDSAYLAAQVAAGLLGQTGEGEKEILSKLTPYAKKREVAQSPLSDRLWQTCLFHPSVRSPLGEICHTHPVCLRVGGKYLTGLDQKEAYYLLGRTMALLRPELALTQRLAPERLEAVIQATITLSVEKYRVTVHPNAIDAERRLLE